jgi:TRAP-type C4-dicarboxylate transport system permease small subunit
VFKTIKKILDLLLEILVMVVVIALVLDVLLQVLVRFAPRILEIIPERVPILKLLKWILRTGTEELAVFMLIWVSLLGAAVALGRGAHLGIDYFVGKLPVKIRIFTEVFVFLAVALFSFTVMIIGGIELVADTLRLEQMSPALKINVGYVYLAVPISGFFMVLYSVIGLGERLAELVKGKAVVEPTTSHVEEGVD